MENTTMNTTIETHITSTIDYAKIETRAAREALASAKNKEHLITLAVSLGVLTSKASKAAKTIKVDALRAQIEDTISVAESRAKETPAQRDARVGVITQAMADEVDGKLPENAGKHAAPEGGASVKYDTTFTVKMMPGEAPYTPEEQAKLSRLVSGAARADVTERDEVEGNVLAQPINEPSE